MFKFWRVGSLLLSGFSESNHPEFTDTKGCVKKPYVLCFLNNFLIDKYYENSQGYDLLHKKQHVNFESIIRRNIGFNGRNLIYNHASFIEACMYR